MKINFVTLLIIFTSISACGLFINSHKLAEELSGLKIPTNAPIVDFRNHHNGIEYKGIVFISIDISSYSFDSFKNQLDESKELPPKNNLQTFIPEVNESLRNRGVYQIKYDEVDPGEFTLIIVDETENLIIIYYSQG